MSQVSMSSSLSYYMQDSEYLKIQAELDREKSRQLTESGAEAEVSNKNTAAGQASLERQLKDREAELDLQRSLQLEETNKKEQRQKEVLEAERTQREKENNPNANDETAAQSAQTSPVTKDSEMVSETNGKDANEEVTEQTEEENTRQLQMERFELLQGHMRSLQNMNVLGGMFLQKISQTSGEIRTDSDEYGYSPYSKSITEKEAARGDLERRKESVDDRAGKTLRDTFNVLKEDRSQEGKNRSGRMTQMQQNLSGLDYANTAFSHNVNFTF